MSIYIQLLSGHVHEVSLKPGDTVREIQLELYDLLQTRNVVLSRLEGGEYTSLSEKDSLIPGETYYAVVPKESNPTRTTIASSRKKENTLCRIM